MRGYSKFKGYLVEKGITQTTIGEILNIPRSRVNLILNGQRDQDFSIQDVIKLCQKFNISADIYFFDQNVASMQLTEE